MEDFASMISGARDLMAFEMSIYGFTFSFWDIFLWSIVATVVLYVVMRYFE